MVWPLLGPLLVVLFEALVFVTMVIIIRRAARQHERTWLLDQSSSSESEPKKTMPDATPIPPRAA